MKILPIDLIRQADAYTIQNEPIADIDLMERAAGKCFQWIIGHFDNLKKVSIFCGSGNNGGDGLVIARLLAQKNFTVDVYMLRLSDKLSESCETNYQRLLEIKSVNIFNINEGDKLPEIGDADLIVDAIFGSGLARPVKGYVAEIIGNINESKVVVISVDVPSGLFCDSSNAGQPGAIVKADYTLSFNPPKLAFFLPENDQFVGNWKTLDIGIMQEFIDSVDVRYYVTEKEDIRSFLKKRNKFSHKGHFGHGLLISGSYGKMGACVLGAKAGLRSGAGLITAHIPGCGYEIMQAAVPEAMVSIDDHEKCISGLPDISKYNAIAVGPGIGTDTQTQNTLKLLIQNSHIPLIFDADAINILGENKTWIPFIPPASVFTPHPKEFERLVGKAGDDFDRLHMQSEFSQKYHCFVVLKGAYSAISCPDGNIYFNPTGNPGMATGGTGDVLTGILLGLKAQGYSSKEACIMGVFLHGLAGDIAAEVISHESLIAGDIIEKLGSAHLNLSTNHD